MTFCFPSFIFAPASNMRSWQSVWKNLHMKEYLFINIHLVLKYKLCYRKTCHFFAKPSQASTEHACSNSPSILIFSTLFWLSHETFKHWNMFRKCWQFWKLIIRKCLAAIYCPPSLPLALHPLAWSQWQLLVHRYMINFSLKWKFQTLTFIHQFCMPI